MNLPNQLTLLRILLSPVFLFLLFIDRTGSQIAAFIVFIIASLTDWYDGYAARKSGNVSLWGRFLDPLADKILVSSALIGFSILGYIPAWMIVIIVARDVIITALRSYAIWKKRPIVTSQLAKVKTFGQFSLIYAVFLVHLFSRRSADSLILEAVRTSNAIPVFAFLITILTLVTGLLYLANNRTHFQDIATDLSRSFNRSEH